MKQKKSLSGNSTKKKKIIIGCAIRGAVTIGLAAGLSVGLTQCACHNPDNSGIIDAKYLDIREGVLYGFIQPYDVSWGTKLIIPATVITINPNAFYNCFQLTSLTIPNSVNSIGNSVFYGCSGLTSLTIPDSVVSIGSNAFYYCSRLTSLTIPDSLDSIPSSAFSRCSGLTSLTIPDSVVSIGSEAFSTCLGLTSLDLINFTGTYGMDWIRYCSQLKNVYISGTTSMVSEKTSDDGWDNVGPESDCKLYAPNVTFADTFRENIIVGTYFTIQQAAKWVFTPY